MLPTTTPSRSSSKRQSFIPVLLGKRRSLSCSSLARKPTGQAWQAAPNVSRASEPKARLRASSTRYGETRDTRGLHPLQNMEAAHPVDKEDQPALVDEHIVARRPIGAGCRIGHEMRNLARRLWPADIDDAQAMGEPGGRNFGAGDLLDRLMAGGRPRLWRAVERLDLKGCDRHRPVFHGDVDDPEEGRWPREQMENVLVRHHKELAAVDLERHRHGAVGRA